MCIFVLNHKTAYFTFTMWGISEWKGIEEENNISTWLEMPVNVITSQHLCFESDLLDSCQDPVAEQTESISFLTSWYVKSRHCKRQGERWHIPPPRASADLCRLRFPVEMVLSYRVQVPERRETLSVCDTQRSAVNGFWWILSCCKSTCMCCSAQRMRC